MRDKLRRLMAEAFETDLESVTPESSMETLEGWDSLGHIKLVAALEQEFGLKLDQDQIVAATSFARIEALLAARG
jgi:acyl carrier protein